MDNMELWLSKELKPCPFCGWHTPALKGDGMDRCHIQCPGCGGSGGTCKGPSAARTQWNIRVDYPNKHPAEDCPWKCKPDSKECLCRTKTIVDEAVHAYADMVKTDQETRILTKILKPFKTSDKYSCESEPGMGLTLWDAETPKT